MTEIYTLIEDKNGVNKALTAEKGLSLFIKTGGKKILFDFGSTGKFIDNAEIMGINLRKTDFAVCSHNHYDHSGGFIKLCKMAKPHLIIGTNFSVPKYSKSEDELTYIGGSFDEKTLKRLSVNYSVCNMNLQILENVFVVNGFKRETEFEHIDEKYVSGYDGNLEHDEFLHETVLAIDGEDGMTVVVGCSHTGIINILNEVKRRFDRPITSVVGGVHLSHATDENIEKTVDAMAAMGVKNFALTHCSGDRVEECVKRKGLKFIKMHTGDVFFAK